MFYCSLGQRFAMLKQRDAEIDRGLEQVGEGVQVSAARLYIEYRRFAHFSSTFSLGVERDGAGDV